MSLSDKSTVAMFALAILSPVISSIITSVFNLIIKVSDHKAEEKKRKADYYYAHRAEVIEHFISSSGAIISIQGTSPALTEFGESCGEIYIYVDSSLWPDIDNLQDLIAGYHWAEARTCLLKLCKSLSHESVRQIDANKRPKKDVDKKHH